MAELVAEPAADAEAAAAATLAAIDALENQGAQRLDPLRLAYLKALARRTAAHQGLARQLLELKLQAALEQMADWLQTDQIRPRPTMAATAPPTPGPLAMLVQQVDQQAGVPSWPAAATAERPLAELKALKNFRGNWARLAVDQQLRRSEAKAPVNAGPLNPQRVVLRSLQAMRGLSPAYLGSFMTYLDTLAWLDEALRAEQLVARAPARGQAGGTGAGRSAKKRRTAGRAGA